MKHYSIPCAIGLLSIAASIGRAQTTYQWNGTTNASWNTSTNWSVLSGAGTTFPGIADTATFNNAGNSNVVIGLAGQSVSTVLFDTASAAAYTLGAGAVGSETLTIANSGAVTVNSTVAANQLVNAAITLGANATTGAYGFTNSSTTNRLTFAGAIAGGSTGTAGTKTLTLNAAGTIGSGSGMVLSGAISNGGATAVAVTKTNIGTAVLEGSPNSYTGLTTVSRGTLQLNKAGGNAVPGNLTLQNTSANSSHATVQLLASNQIVDTAALTMSCVPTAGPSFFGMGAFNETVASLSLTNSSASTAWTPITGSGTLTVNGNISMDGGTGSGAPRVNVANIALNLGGATRQITTTNTGETRITSVIDNGGITKLGSNALNVLGANLYAGGTTVSAGAFLANNTTGSATGSGTVTVGTTGVLGGGDAGGTAGFVGGPVSITTTGFIAPGSTTGAAVGTLTIANDLTIDGTYTYEAGDQIKLTGSGTLILGASSTLALSGVLDPGTTYTIAQYTDGRSGVFGNTSSITTHNVVYGSTTGAGTVQLTPVPEPGTLAVGGLVAAALFARRRRNGDAR